MRKIALIALFLMACTREEPSAPATASAPPKPAVPPPSAAEARTIIMGSMEFGEFQFTEASYSLPVSGVMMNEPQRKAARDLANAGWVRLESSGDVALNDKSRTDRRFLMRPNGLLDIVPLAKKEMGAVQAVRTNDDGTVSADFTWSWIPNEIATTFIREKYEGTQAATATLMHDGTNWTVLKIVTR
ncbi:MAG TPA: hypothetical protein VNA69_24875 [Thermoanaerobaculia bacterium]|nr:hypothetical protein [Thermoanaerobaculia bacterium]